MRAGATVALIICCPTSMPVPRSLRPRERHSEPGAVAPPARGFPLGILGNATAPATSAPQHGDRYTANPPDPLADDEPEPASLPPGKAVPGWAVPPSRPFGRSGTLGFSGKQHRGVVNPGTSETPPTRRRRGPLLSRASLSRATSRLARNVRPRALGSGVTSDGGSGDARRPDRPRVRRRRHVLLGMGRSGPRRGAGGGVP